VDGRTDAGRERERDRDRDRERERERERERQRDRDREKKPMDCAMTGTKPVVCRIWWKVAE
jgi:hypothetical protein